MEIKRGMCRNRLTLVELEALSCSGAADCTDCVMSLVKLCGLSLTPVCSAVVKVETVGEKKTKNHLCFSQS